MRIASWNVNGLRSIVGKGFLDWAARSGADLIGLQETRCAVDQVPAPIRELGLGDDHAGILELDTTAAPGTRFIDALGMADHQIVIDVPASRPDLLCHKGIARELAAALGGTVKLPEIPGGQAGGRAGGPRTDAPARPTVRQSDRPTL